MQKIEVNTTYITLHSQSITKYAIAPTYTTVSAVVAPDTPLYFSIGDIYTVL
jgi:hypothetical protein